MDLDLVQIQKPKYITHITFPEMKQLIPAKEYDIMETLQAVCDKFGLDKEDVLAHNDSSKREYVIVRQITMTLAKLESKLSLVKIGSLFQKDHATVLWAIKTVYNLRQTNREFREQTDSLFYGLIWPYIKN